MVNLLNSLFVVSSFTGGQGYSFFGKMVLGVFFDTKTS